MARQWRKYEVGKYRLGTLFNPKIGQPEAVVVWKDGDGPHRRRLGVFNETEGRIALDRFVGNLAALKGRDGLTVGMIWEEYVADRAKDGKLIAVFHDNWKALKKRFEGMRVADITDDVCRDYARERLANGRTITRKGPDGNPEAVVLKIGVGTVWTELLRLRSALNWAFDRELIHRKKHIWIPRKPDPKKRPLTVEEFLRLREACQNTPHLRLYVIIALTTAGRTEAILELIWTKIDFYAWTIDLRAEKGQEVDPLSKRARKGRALVPMTEEARAALLEAKNGALTDHVIEWDGKPVKSIRKAFAAAVERAGLGTYEPDPTRPGKQRFVTDVTPHTLRHTAVSWAEEEGYPMDLISRLAAHGSPDVTRRIYAKPGVDVLRPVAAAIDRRLQGLPAPPDAVADAKIINPETQID